MSGKERYSMNGKVCLVTGATSGIGLAAASELAAMGATVALVGRNQAKGEGVQAQIQAASGSTRVDYLNADLSVQSEVRALARDFLGRYDRLDVLLNNAGAVFLQRQVTPEGIEKTFALNHLAYFLLTNLLLDLLSASAPARIINVSSRSHYKGQIDFENLNLARNYWIMRAYEQSKLANVLFTYELARRLDGTGVTATAVDPGRVGTSIGGNIGWIGRLFNRWWKARTLPPEQGARTLVYLAVSPEVAGETGKYYVDQKAIRSSTASYDRNTARRLWEESARLTGL